ncbi:TPA: hypothetical protein ACINTT_002009 [Streptococcus agalactiae]|uniref:hypothetical protein n=1 Tax=Streptococcus agalactiae TaxID=1311 RepID=UPI002AD88D68|nr:hypothetical protein [Streptococcus agalactiae]HEO0839018.1 hypothetical protein [Streptococcus agalactiae]HEO0963726.1 hypothetical protein [Streptococcus agalactiae]HEO2641819.1 hypothetical protein [Streptococcus agalactiae]HEO3056357.1 hypothetical protein [Streptococcus agalactiae]
MTNLWEETIDILKEHDKTFDGVRFVQGYDFKITKENFEQVAKKTNYDRGYGAAHVATDLVVVGKNWWLERGEYDGSEWWEYKESPKQVNEVREISHLAGGLWPTLEKLNSPKNPMQERVEKLRKGDIHEQATT